MTRNTRQKEIVLSVLKERCDHPTAQEIYEAVRMELPRISLGTVYRNLEVLSENGTIRKIDAAGREKRYDANRVRHFHFRCLNCGKVEDIPVSLSPPSGNLSDPWFSDRKVYGFSLEMTGLCPGCTLKRGTEE